MLKASKKLDFEEAIRLRDEIAKIKTTLISFLIFVP